MKKSEVTKAVEQKTDYQSRRGKELNYVIYRGRRRISRMTIPKGRGELSRGAENSIRRQLRLDKQQFNDFVKCSMSGADYATFLDEQIARGRL